MTGGDIGAKKLHVPLSISPNDEVERASPWQPLTGSLREGIGAIILLRYTTGLHND